MSARQALILLVTKNQMLRLTTPNARTRQSPLGKTRRRGRLTTVGLRPPFVSQPRRHSHPDCRSLLTLIVAQQAPAINVSGQIAFVETGDVMKPFDFHGLHISPAKRGQALPRIKADGLGVDIGLSGTAKLRGSVVAVDESISSIEGTEFVPDGYKTYGFLGDGQLSIEGWGSMSASMGFLEVERPSHPGERRKSFFLYLQKEKVAYEIPTPIWTFYLREVGFGFGFRYTLEGIKAAENAKSAAQLVKILDDVSKRQGDLARFSTWRPDPEGDKVTLALRGAMQMYPAVEGAELKTEKEDDNPFFFDLVAALRSDMTFLMSARGWLAVNYYDFFNDRDGLRSRPGFRGYLYISAPRSELLARVIGDSTGYIGERLDLSDEVKQALRSVDWSATLYIRPGLLHYELGWPDQLVVRLKNEPKFRVIVRGGMIFRGAEDGLLWGYNIEADAFLAFSGVAGGDLIGVALEGSLTARFVARLIAYLNWRLKGSLLYGLISLDANIVFSVRAWLKIDLGIRSITIPIGFPFSIEFTAVVEIAISPAGVGAQVRARVGVSVFGCTLSVGVGFAINNSKLQEARARVDRFLALGITAETPDPAKVITAERADDRLDSSAQEALAPHEAPDPPPVPPPGPGQPRPPIKHAALGRKITRTDFWLVLRRAEEVPASIEKADDVKDPSDYCFAILVPREPVSPEVSGFYSAPVKKAVEKDEWTYQLKTANKLSKVWRWDAPQRKFTPFEQTADVKVNWDAAVPAETDQGERATEFTLARLFDECFLYDAEWQEVDGEPQRTTTQWTEPTRRLRHRRAAPLGAIDETERNSRRDQHQRERAASAAITGPVVEGVREARNTVLTHFLDQFVTLARTGRRATAENGADVTDLGLIFFGKSELSGDIILCHYELTKPDVLTPGMRGMRSRA